MGIKGRQTPSKSVTPKTEEAIGYSGQTRTKFSHPPASAGIRSSRPRRSPSGSGTEQGDRDLRGGYATRPWPLCPDVRRHRPPGARVHRCAGPAAEPAQDLTHATQHLPAVSLLRSKATRLLIGVTMRQQPCSFSCSRSAPMDLSFKPIAFSNSLSRRISSVSSRRWKVSS